MGVRQSCKISNLSIDLAKEEKQHKITKHKLDVALKKLAGSDKQDMYSFDYIDAYGVRIPKRLTYEQAEALTEWLVIRHLAGRCRKCGFATDYPELLLFDLLSDKLICSQCGAEMVILDAPAPPEPWGNGSWCERGLDPLSSIWVGLQNAYPEFEKARWGKRHGYEPRSNKSLNERLTQEIKSLKKRLKQLECTHGITEIKMKPVTFRDIQTDSMYTKDIAFKICKLCGKELSQLSKASHLAFLIDDFIEKEVSDGNGVIKSVEKLREANERLRVAISDAAPDA